MSILGAHLILLVPSVLLTALLAAMIWSGKNPHPPTYKMSEPWTHDPILWAAVDETVGAAHSHDSQELKVGGGASGKW